jgi:hypothetical protein
MVLVKIGRIVVKMGELLEGIFIVDDAIFVKFLMG